MKELDKLNIPYIHQKPINNGKFVADFMLPKHKIIIECNGDYWHSLPNRIERDKQIEEYVKNNNGRVVFLWEHKINEDSEKALIEALEECEVI